MICTVSQPELSFPELSLTLCIVLSAAESVQSSASTNKDRNIVIRAALVHVIGDLIQSVGVLVAALIIRFLVRIMS